MGRSSISLNRFKEQIVGDDARSRIIVLYLKSLLYLSRVGEGRLLHETHREHCSRVPKITKLSSFYEKARFSTEEMSNDENSANDAFGEVTKRK